MFGNCDQKKKMPIMFSNTNPLASTMQGKNMIVASSQQHQQPQLNCPRCDSSNTKFCYYNNYSLSQPRHFCKSCKRYWTRGGTLRNVPVGGSYRKNKRVKRPSTANATATSTTTSPSPNNSHQISHISFIDQHPLFYGLSSNHGAMTRCNNLPMVPSRYNDSSSSGLESEFLSSGFSNALGIEHPHHMSHDHTINGSSFINNSSTNKPFLLSSLYKPMTSGGEMMGQSHLQTLASFQDMHVEGNNEDMSKQGKHDHISGNINGFMSSISLDPPYYNNLWNNSGYAVTGAWVDPTNNNVGSSLTSLI